MLDPYGAANDDAHFQILDFQETLQKCIQDDQKIYGQKNKPRNEEPSMFQMLTWNDAEGDNWNYTVKNKNILESSLTNQLKYRINKSSSNWTTENMDQFRKFTYSPSKQPVFYDLHDPANARVRLTTSQGPDVSRNLAEQLARSSKGLHPHQHQIALDKASETADKYTVQNMRNLNNVLKVIEGRAINKAGEVVRNPVAQQVAGRTERQKQSGHYAHDGEYYDEEQYEGQEGRQDEEESEQVEVEKLDLSNVKSRLLEKKIKTAKKLDPVYEKERLDRRNERIKRLNETTRWLPNSAFKTYFGKAPFENYGRGNINPTVGGSVYGDYLKSHNVNPHSGGNKPQYKQVYAHADFAATRYPDAQPEPPRKCKDDYRLSQKQVEELKRRNPLVGEKFGDDPKTIIKPDLVNSLRFASEENTPEQSFEEEKPKKSKNLRESLKQLGKKARAIRQDFTKNKSVKAERTKSVTRSPDVLQSPQPSVQESAKAASAKKPTSATLQAKKVSSTKKAVEAEPKRKTVKIEEQDVVPQERSQKKLNRVAQQQADLEEFRNARTEPTKGELEHEYYEKIKAFNASEVGNLMRDPASALQAQPRISQSQEQSRKAVTFKEAPAPQQRGQQLSYGKVEDLSTLIKEAQKNEKLIEKINEDMGGTLNVNPMKPPKDYLFSLSQKETDPRYYKNVPSVWLQRIPCAGKQSGKHEDIRGVFGGSD